MKKILIGLLIVVGLVIVIGPLVGKKMIQETLNERMSELDGNGLEIQPVAEESGYFATHASYAVKLQEGDKFLDYIASYQKTQIPPYVKGMLDGAEIGFDMDYSHLPFMQNVKVGIYPTKLPPALAKDLRLEIPELYESIETMMTNKQIYYQIDYSLVSDTFTGSIRDIDKAILNIDASTVAEVTMKGATFDGLGTLIAPNAIKGAINQFDIVIKDDSDAEFKIALGGTQFDNAFKSMFDYTTSLDAKQMSFSFEENGKSATAALNDIAFKSASNVAVDKINSTSQTSMAHFSLQVPGEKSVIIDRLTFNVSASELDRKALEEFQVALNKIQAAPTPHSQDEILKHAFALLEKGFVLNISELSVDDVKLDSDKGIGGFRHNATLTIKPDPDLKEKMRNPMALAQNVALDAKLIFSKSFFNHFMNELPQLAIVAGFAKEDGDNMRFDILFNGVNLTVNGKPLM
jgi:hypothetical protein